MLIINIFLLIVTILIRFFHNELNYDTVTISYFAVFLLSALNYILIICKKKLIRFEFFFLTIFFFTTYMYPIFLIDIFEHPMFSFSNKENIINSLFISTFGIIIFIIGSIIGQKQKKPIFKDYNYQINYDKISFILSILTFILLIHFIIFKLETYLNYYYTDVNLSSDFYLRHLLLISIIFEYFKIKKSYPRVLFNKINKLTIINTISIIIITFLGGDRGGFIQILLFIFILIYNLRHFNNIKIIILCFIGFLLMSNLKNIRSKDGGLLKVTNYTNLVKVDIVDFSKDFLAASGTLYCLVDITKNYGNNNGNNALFPFLSTVPFLQSTYITIFDIDLREKKYLPSSIIATKSILGENPHTGLGTHIIGDLYYSFGMKGVILLLFIAGYLISLLYKFSNTSNIYSVFLNSFVISNSIYFSRSEFFSYFRSIGFSLIIIFIIINLFNNSNKVNS